MSRCFTGAALAGAMTLTVLVQAADRPNIVLILADDLGYGDLGCYGQKRIQTPHIDRLAKEGLRFTDFYAGCTVCAPSRCVLMTGYHMGHAQIRGNGAADEIQVLRDQDVTAAEVLKKAGYATALCGKWGLGDEGSIGVPNKQGFDYFFGYLNQHHAHNYYPAYLFKNEQRFPLKNVVPGEGDFGGGVASQKVEYSPDLITAEALKWVEAAQGPAVLPLLRADDSARQQRRPPGRHGSARPRPVRQPPTGRRSKRPTRR